MLIMSLLWIGIALIVYDAKRRRTVYHQVEHLDTSPTEEDDWLNNYTAWCKQAKVHAEVGPCSCVDCQKRRISERRDAGISYAEIARMEGASCSSSYLDDNCSSSYGSQGYFSSW